MSILGEIKLVCAGSRCEVSEEKVIFLKCVPYLIGRPVQSVISGTAVTAFEETGFAWVVSAVILVQVCMQV